MCIKISSKEIKLTNLLQFQFGVLSGGRIMLTGGRISHKYLFFRFTHRKIPVFGAHPGQIIFFSKNGLHHFLGEPSGYLHAKFQKNLGCGYRENLVTNERTNERTDGLTEPKL